MMKITKKRLSAGLGACAAALFLLMPAAVAGAGHSAGGSDDPGNGDDDIGTLPSMTDETGLNLVLIGSLQELHAVILGVTGQGSTTVQAAPGGEYVVVFDGDLSVRLDLLALAQGGVRGGVVVGNLFADGIVSIYTHGSWSEPTTVAAFTAGLGATELPLAAIGGLGAPAALRILSPKGGDYRLHMLSKDGVLVLSQQTRPALGRDAI